MVCGWAGESSTAGLLNRPVDHSPSEQSSTPACVPALHLHNLPLISAFIIFTIQTGRDGLMPGGIKLMGPQKTSFVHIINLSIFQRFY